MHRLLQGEVGSGKTVVAVAALLTGVDGGYQGAVMAPTEVLAVQHYLGIAALLASPGWRPISEGGGGGARHGVALCRPMGRPSGGGGPAHRIERRSPRAACPAG